MKAEDTIMNLKEVEALWLENWDMVNNLPPSLEVWGKVQPLRQAEISFKAGQEEEYKKWTEAFKSAGIMITDADKVSIAIDITRREGIKEVVEWLKEEGKCRHGYFHYCSSCDNSLEVGVNEQQWQAKLKEWGITDVQT